MTNEGPPFLIAELDGALHDRAAFNSDSERLNIYLQKQASQDVRKRLAKCYVALANDTQIAGYYTLSAASVALTELPKELATKMPRYPSVPAARMGRLAIDKDFAGRGLGSALLADAIYRAMNSTLGCYALFVDAKSNHAARFYQHHGFQALPESPLTLFTTL